MQIEDDWTSYEEVMTLVFGTDPAQWAAILRDKLLIASDRLRNARAFLADKSRDTSDKIDAAAVDEVRRASGLLLGELYNTLSAMPLMQMAPEALDGLHYVLKSIVDLDRGAAPKWLVAKSTNHHPKPTPARVEWLGIVTAVQLVRLLPEFKREDSAVKEIKKLTGRPVSTIKGWCRRLFNPTTCEVPEARQEVEMELATIRAVLMVTPASEHSAIIRRRAKELLPTPNA
ncbi:MAG: hypothetical protein KGQ75_14435 [Sphingomonadales bacterium]|nr:hypothetical protein [Sphingomonadales bacterium]